MSVENNNTLPEINHEALKKALLQGDIDAALVGQLGISEDIPRKKEEDIVGMYEFSCKMEDTKESFPSSPNFTTEMCEVLDKDLFTSV